MQSRQNGLKMQENIFLYLRSKVKVKGHVHKVNLHPEMHQHNKFGNSTHNGEGNIGSIVLF